MRKITTLSVAFATIVMVFGQMVSAQDRGQGRDRGQRGPQRGGASATLFALASAESVQAELDMLDDQIKDLKELQEKLRGDRGTQTGRRQSDNDDNDDMTEEEIQEQRDERRAQGAEQAAESEKKAVEGIKEILLDHQFDRLNEIYVQALGTRALQDEAIAKKLNITKKQQSEMEEVTNKAREGAREVFSELRESGGDREAMQKKMSEFRSEIEGKMMGVLSAKQKAQFEKMKGEAFEIPADALRGQRGGGQRGGGDRGGRGGDRRGGGDRQGGDRSRGDDGA